MLLATRRHHWHRLGSADIPETYNLGPLRRSHLAPDSVIAYLHCTVSVEEGGFAIPGAGHHRFTALRRGAPLLAELVSDPELVLLVVRVCGRP